MDANSEEDIEKIERKDKPLGLGLVSGGLDSLIACLILKLQDIDVIALNFKSPFCVCDKAYKNAECGLNLYYEKLGIDVHYQYKDDDYLEVVRNPKFGYGKNLNPCIDCRIYILKKAKKYAADIGADIIFTGEVVNQRPKSQNYRALEIIEKKAGLEDKLLRPLSALLLNPTIFEKNGLIDRGKLLGISGRSRKIQLELARKYGLLKEYFACGGCLLTDNAFSKKLKDYFKFNKKVLMKDVYILKYGRHFRYNGSKIIVGRNESENSMLIRLKKSKDIMMEAEDFPSPITIIQGEINNNVLNFAAEITLRYSDCKDFKGNVRFGTEMNELNRTISVENIEVQKFKNMLI